MQTTCITTRKENANVLLVKKGRRLGKVLGVNGHTFVMFAVGISVMLIADEDYQHKKEDVYAN